MAPLDLTAIFLIGFSFNIRKFKWLYTCIFNTKLVQKSGEGREEKGVEITPMKDITKLSDVTPEDKKRWLSIGYQEIADGHVALLLMAGGQVLQFQ